jgi:sugar lactone lactonase YvrE
VSAPLSAAEVHLRGEAVVGEGVCWDPARGRLIWVDIESRQVLVNQDGSTRVFSLPGRVGVAVPTHGEALIVAYDTQIGLLSTADGSLVGVTELAETPGRVRFNDGGTDPSGGFWVGTAPLDEREHGIAAVFRLQPNGDLVKVLGELGLANGLSWSPDGRFMYVADTLGRAILRMARDPDSGRVGEPALFVDTTAIAGAPDGMAIDESGNLWVAFWDGAAVHRFSGVDGRPLGHIPLPVRRPTSCAFAGPRLERLLITSARLGLTDDELRAQPLAGSMFAATIPGVRGLAPTDARLPGFR